MSAEWERPADLLRLEQDGEEYLVLSLPLRVPAGLTPSEGEVAHLATAGLTEGEIAHRRGVSRKTVHNQIQSIYSKLGVRDRAELARALSAGS